MTTVIDPQLVETIRRWKGMDRPAEKVDAEVVPINFLIGDGSAAISTGIKGVIQTGFPFTIVSWSLFSGNATSGSITVDLKKTTYAGFPGSLASITAAAKPSISSSTKNTSGTLTGWTTSVSDKEILQVVVDSASTLTLVTLHLRVKVTIPQPA